MITDSDVSASSAPRLRPAAGEPRILIGLFVLCFAVRTAFCLLTPVRPLNPDSAEFGALARTLSESGEFGFGNWREDPALRTSFQSFLYAERGAYFRTPGYPAILVAAEKVLGPGPRRLQLLLSAVDGLTAVLLFLLARRWLGSGAATLAALAWCFWPGGLYSLSNTGREPILTLATVLLSLAVLDAAATPKIARAIAAGLFAGLATLVKETVLPIALLAGAGLLFLAWRERRREIAIWSAVLVAVTFLTLLPWMLRNQAVAGKWVGLSDMDRMALWVGTGAQRWVLAEAPPATREALDPFGAPSIAEAERRLTDGVRSYVHAHPAEAGLHLLQNVGWFWSPVGRFRQTRGLLDWVLGGTYVALYLLAAFGAVRWRGNLLVSWTVLLLAALGAAHAASLATPRYRLPFEPLLLVLAAAGVVALRTRRAGPPDQRRRSSVTTVAA